MTSARAKFSIFLYFLHFLHFAQVYVSGPGSLGSCESFISLKSLISITTAFPGSAPLAPEINPPFPQIPHFLHFPRVCVSSGPGFPGAFNSPISLCIQILVFFIPLTSAFPGPAPSAPSFSSFPSLFTSLKSPKSAVPGPAPSQCRMQRRFHGDDGILTLFCEPESPESSPRTFLSGLYVLHSQWG